MMVKHDTTMYMTCIPISHNCWRYMLLRNTGGFEIPVIEPLVDFGFTVFVDVPVRAVIGAVIGAVDNDCEPNIYFFAL